ncbi:MAG: hypothetical protein ACAF41_33780 (plasmid) [Leptolyngbya sp. BL-A-14]
MMRYRIKLEFLCHEHRLRGTVEQDRDESKLGTSTLRQLLDGLRSTILERYPYISDAIDRIDLLDLRIEPL